MMIVAGDVAGLRGPARRSSADLRRRRERSPRRSAAGRRWRSPAAPRAARGCRRSSALSNSDSTSASSILRPLYWTMTRSAVSATTPMLWVIMISAHAVLGLQPHQQVEDLLLDRHVERGGRLVGDQQLRVAGDGDGDHHALALAARHLVREGLQPLAPARGCRPRSAARWRGRGARPCRGRCGRAAPPRSGSRR